MQILLLSPLIIDFPLVTFLEQLLFSLQLSDQNISFHSLDLWVNILGWVGERFDFFFYFRFTLLDSVVSFGL